MVYVLPLLTITKKNYYFKLSYVNFVKSIYIIFLCFLIIFITTTTTTTTTNHILVAAVMSARLHVNKPLLRRSSLALNRINVHVGSRKGSGNGNSGGSGGGTGGANENGVVYHGEGNAFEELRTFVKQVSFT